MKCVSYTRYMKENLNKSFFQLNLLTTYRFLSDYSQFPNKRGGPFPFFFKKISNSSALIRTPSLLIFQFYLKKKKILLQDSKFEGPVPFLKKFSKSKGKHRCFNSVYFSPRVNISFQLSIFKVTFLSLKKLFLNRLSTFFSFHKLELCSHVGKV